jgi:hypothetical protein
MTTGKLLGVRICLSHLWQWFHRCQNTLKLIKLYILNVGTLLFAHFTPTSVDKSPKAQETKAKIRQIGFHQTKKLLQQSTSGSCL